MTIDVNFKETDQSFDAKFNDGDTGDGYDQGYAEGEKVGYNKGYAEGEQKGHESGYADGEQAATAAAEAHNAIILADCNAVLPTKGVEPAETLEQVPDRIEEIETGGGGNLLDYAVTLGYLFSQVTFPAGYEADITFCRYGTPTTGMLDATFNRANNLKSIKVTCVQAVTDAFRMTDFCRSVTELQKLDLSGVQPLKPSRIDNAFYGCAALQEIIGTFDFSECTNFKTPFTNCGALQNVRIAPGTINLSLTLSNSPLLSDDSIQSIIDGLADLTGQTTQTLTLHKDVGAKLTDAQKATITAKNWTLAY